MTHRRMRANILVSAVIGALQLRHTASAAATFERVSVASDGTQGNSFSNAPAITPDGRFVAFNSAATNLAGRPSGLFDIYVRDRATGLTTLESVGMNGAPANGGSIVSSISADGRFVAFSSDATNLTPGVTRAINQVYVRDRLLGITTLVSATPSGVAGNGRSQMFKPGVSISADGRFVTFDSAANDLVPNDTNGRFDVFTRDLQTGTTTRESVASDGTQATFGGNTSLISGNGRYVAFVSDNSLVPGSPASGGAYVRDRVTGQLTFESIDPAGVPLGGNGSAAPTAISADGHFMVFFGGGVSTIYLRDLQSRETITVSTDASLTDVTLSADGRYVIYDGRFSLTLLVYDRLSGQTVTFTSGLSPSAGTSSVAFDTKAALVHEDTNGAYDVYVYGEPIRGAPTGLTASSSGSGVTLTWTSPSTGTTTTSYIIEAGSSPGATNLANFSTGSTATTFSASGVAAGTYYVRVRASNSVGTSPPSNEVTLIVGGGCAGPGAPSNLGAAVSGSTVTLTWAAGSGATSYLLLVGSGPGRSDLLVRDLGSTATMLTASNVAAGTYFGRVQSLNACGQSGPSNEVVATVR